MPTKTSANGKGQQPTKVRLEKPTDVTPETPQEPQVPYGVPGVAKAGVSKAPKSPPEDTRVPQADPEALEDNSEDLLELSEDYMEPDDTDEDLDEPFVGSEGNGISNPLRNKKNVKYAKWAGLIGGAALLAVGLTQCPKQREPEQTQLEPIPSVQPSPVPQATAPAPQPTPSPNTQPTPTMGNNYSQLMPLIENVKSEAAIQQSHIEVGARDYFLNKWFKQAATGTPVEVSAINDLRDINQKLLTLSASLSELNLSIVDNPQLMEQAQNNRAYARARVGDANAIISAIEVVLKAQECRDRSPDITQQQICLDGVRAAVPATVNTAILQQKLDTVLQQFIVARRAVYEQFIRDQRIQQELLTQQQQNAQLQEQLNQMNQGQVPPATPVTNPAPAQPISPAPTAVPPLTVTAP